MASRPKQTELRPAPRLYLITPPLAAIEEFAAALPRVLDAGDVAAVLLRLAEADERTLINRVKALAPLVQDKDAALLTDGHEEIVARGGADGAHLRGIEAFSAAIEALKPDRITGVGALTSRHDAMLAAEQGADYVLFGEQGDDPDVTLDRVVWWAEVFEIPCVAYAGASSEIAPLITARADFIALDYVWASADPAGALRDAANAMRLPEAVQ